MSIKFSFIIPIYNEKDSILKLVNEIKDSLNGKLSLKEFEIIFVDDGSDDGSSKLLKEIQKTKEYIRYIKIRSNQGKSMALSVGFNYAKGKYIITMDGDLQDNPKDIFKLYEKLKSGFDMVVGVRKKRNDQYTRKLGSRIFNFFVSKLSGLHLSDINCGFKIFKSTVKENIDIYGQFHRYIPVVAYLNGFSVGEQSIDNRAREFGKSKFKTIRYESIFDLVSILFLHKFSLSPLHFFGKISLLFIIPSVSIIIYFVMKHLLSLIGLGDYQLFSRPLFSMSLTVLLIGILILLTGIICDFILHHQVKIKLKEKVKNISEEVL